MISNVSKRQRVYQKIVDKLEEWAIHLMVVALVLTMCVLFFWNMMVITVHAGEGAVLYKRFFGGTVLDRVYAEGIHFIWPWDKMTIYNVRVQQKRHEFEALAKGGLKVKLILSMRYKPDYDVLAVLHASVGEDYMEKIVIPEVESTVRSAIGQFTPEELYSSKQSQFQEVVNEAVERTNRKFVQVDDVMIVKIELPDMIKEAIENKLTQEQIAQAVVYKIQAQELEAERMRIEAEAIKRFNSIIQPTLTLEILKHKGILATMEIAKSNNSKFVIMGNGEGQLPVILNADSAVNGKNSESK